MVVENIKYLQPFTKNNSFQAYILKETAFQNNNRKVEIDYMLEFKKFPCLRADSYDIIFKWFQRVLNSRRIAFYILVSCQTENIA